MKKLAIILFVFIPFTLFTQQNSNLSTGDWYKIAVEETGVHKISYSDLESYGIDVGNINPQYLAIFGNPAGMLPESIDEGYYTDIQPLAIQVIGDEDGVFDPQDYILFFAQKPDIWEHNDETNIYSHVMNIYTQKTFYFLTVGSVEGKRIQNEQSTYLDATAVPDYYDMLISHDMELVNPTKSGKIWLGENFSEDSEIVFNLQTVNTLQNDSNYFKVVVAAKCSEASQFEIKINGELYRTINIPPSPDKYTKYRPFIFDSLCSVGGENIEVAFVYDKPNDSAQAWIDYFEMELKMETGLVADQMSFRSSDNIGLNKVTQFNLYSELPEELKIWNVTSPMNVRELELELFSDYVSYKLKTDSLLEFHSFNGNTYYSVEFVEQMQNQNLHAITSPDYLIVTHPLFLDAANQLADFHNNEGELLASVVIVDDIYNEFSSGAQDISAIRNFLKYLRENAETESKPNYLLLFGDASYDYLNRVENNTNFVPTFESLSSSNIVTSYASDQFFVLSNMENGGEMLLAVGRIPVSTLEGASDVVNKIQTYNSDVAPGAWINEMIFIADNGDNNLHLRHAESLIEIVKTNTPEMNISKCYNDFFELIQTNEGPRYPEVNTIITDKTNDGLFYANYTGHGGEEGLSEEQILTKEDLFNWTNINKMPLWVIASADVAHFDDPDVISLGEDIITMNETGAIALISTSRVTYAHANFSFNKSVIEKFTDNNTQSNLRFGDLMMRSVESENDLKWVLFGDPALKIHFPEDNVNAITLNDVEIEDYTDTISPGSFLTFTGQIIDKNDGSLQSDFNGTVNLKIFAPQYIRTTLGNQGPSVDIEVQDSILVEGLGTVNYGEFEIYIQLPSNYYENYGNLKLSWYADNGTIDANGYYDQLVFGGNPDAISENSELLDQIKVYPTIFTDFINVKLPNFDYASIVCNVYNLMGAKVYSTRLESVKGIERIHIPELESGMYVFNMDAGNESRNFKLFKQ